MTRRVGRAIAVSLCYQLLLSVTVGVVASANAISTSASASLSNAIIATITPTDSVLVQPVVSQHIDFEQAAIVDLVPEHRYTTLIAGLNPLLTAGSLARSQIHLLGPLTFPSVLMRTAVQLVISNNDGSIHVAISYERVSNHSTVVSSSISCLSERAEANAASKANFATAFVNATLSIGIDRKFLFWSLGNEYIRCMVWPDHCNIGSENRLISTASWIFNDTINGENAREDETNSKEDGVNAEKDRASVRKERAKSKEDGTDTGRVGQYDHLRVEPLDKFVNQLYKSGVFNGDRLSNTEDLKECSDLLVQKVNLMKKQKNGNDDINRRADLRTQIDDIIHSEKAERHGIEERHEERVQKFSVTPSDIAWTVFLLFTALCTFLI